LAKKKTKSKPKPKTTKTKSKVKKETEKKKPTPIKEKKSKPQKKGFLLIIPVIIIICVIGLIWFTQASESVQAQLIIDSGTVQVKQEGGQWTSAEDGMLISQSYSVRTGDNSSATVILFESSIIRLDSNTEITLEEMIKEAETSVKITQDSGRTWNTVLKISGIDDYEVQTPTTVASVRGTAFVIIVQPNGTTYYGVSHGILNVSYVSNGSIQGSIDVSGNESVIVYVDMIGQTLEIKPFDIDDWVLQNLLEDEQLRNDIKNEIYSRIEPYIPELKELYGVTDEELEVLIDGYVQGYFDLPPETPDWIRDLIELS